MDFRFNENVKPSKLLVKMLLVAFVLVFGAMLFGELIVPFASVAYAFIILAESQRKKILTAFVAVLYTALTIVFFVFGIYTLALMESIAIGAIVAALFMIKAPKADIAFYVSAIYLVSIILFICFRTAEALGSFELSAFKDFYIEAYEQIKYDFVEGVRKYSQGAADGTESLDTESVLVIFDRIVCLLPAIFMLGAFFLTGVTLKLFSHCLYKSANDVKQVIFWRFSLPNIVAYVYVATFIISIFVSSVDNVASITLLNFFYFFMFVFAYIGFNFSLVVLSRTRKRSVVTVIIFAAILLFGILAVEILSLCGVFFTRMLNGMGTESISGDKDSK